MNISEIAKRAGVSSATVSRYLNKGYVSQEKQERIREVIEQTGYIPSTQAQMLRTKKTKLVGVVLPKISSESISKIVDGITEKLSCQGYHIILGNTDNNVEKELEYLNIFRNNQVDGIIFIATIIEEEHKKLLKEMTIPVIVVGQEIEGYSCVYHDDYGAAYEMTRYMLQRGCRHLGCIGVTLKDKAAGFQRRQGFLDAIDEAGLSLAEIPVLEGTFSIESGREMMKQLLEKYPQTDGVFCVTDNIAVGAMEMIKEMDRQLPQDVAVAGIGDTSMSKLVTPSLTTMRYYYHTSGVEAATLLLEALQGRLTGTRKIKLGYEMIERESV